jgi:DNA-binding IclR family transcriptional regulator
MPEGRFWFRLPDDEAMLTSLKPAELRCYLVVMRDIQRSRHRGLISARQVSDKTGISLQHTHAALESLVANGHLNCEKRRELPPDSACLSTGNRVTVHP